MTKEEVFSRIKEANAAYRLGNPIMGDSEYDSLVETLRSLVGEDAYSEIAETLNEGAIECDGRKKAKHPFIMGSLEKLKYEDPSAVRKFVDKYVGGKLSVSAKVDGISCRLRYENGVLVGAYTRGDGYVGVDITDKIPYVRFVPSKFMERTCDVRGELVILKDDFAKMSGFANPRNACAGIVNRKDYSVEELGSISFVAYTVLGDAYTKHEQFEMLGCGFKVAWHTEIDPSEFGGNAIADILFDFARQEFEYETDGLVICDAEYRNEEKYRPDACVAFKINQLVGISKIIDIEWW